MEEGLRALKVGWVLGGGVEGLQPLAGLLLRALLLLGRASLPTAALLFLKLGVYIGLQSRWPRHSGSSRGEGTSLLSRRQHLAYD